jgi:hypothetical protein
MDNQLQRCNIRFSNYVSNQGKNVSLRKIIKAIISGERDPKRLCALVHGRTRNKHGEQVITNALSGVIQQADVNMCKFRRYAPTHSGDMPPFCDLTFFKSHAKLLFFS